MEKQSLIKYYCALFLLLVLFAGINNAAIGQNTSKPSSSNGRVTTTSSPVTTQSNANQDISSDNNMLPLIISILALAASGGAIALAISEIKKIRDRISSHDEKHTNKIKLLENKYNELLTSQVASQSNQPREAISHNSTTSNNPNAFLESSVDDLSVRITKLEDKLKITQNNQQSIISSNPTYLSNQSRNQEPDFNPFNQVDGLSQSNTTQPLENLAYIELVNIYRDNPRLLEQKAIKVSEDKDSIARRHTDSSQKIVLEKATNSNYWVIHDVGANCWLLPKSKLRIDQFRYETTKALFECHGYQPEYSTFKLVKPAKVIPLSMDEQTWQLEEPGILEFSVED